MTVDIYEYIPTSKVYDIDDVVSSDSFGLTNHIQEQLNEEESKEGEIDQSRIGSSP